MGSLISVLPKILPIIPGVVKAVEKIFKGQEKAGPQKRAAAIDIVLLLVAPLVMLVEGISGKDLVEDEAFVAAIGQIVDGVVAALNARNELKVV
jgi:hypothetical protein